MKKNMYVNVKVTVTPNNIRTGKRGRLNGCAVGLALGRVVEKRSFGTLVETDLVVIFNRKTGAQWTCKLPLKAIRFIKRFDTSKDKVKPIEFVLRGVPANAICKDVKPVSICQELLHEDVDSCTKACDNCTGCK